MTAKVKGNEDIKRHWAAPKGDPWTRQQCLWKTLIFLLAVLFKAAESHFNLWWVLRQWGQAESGGAARTVGQAWGGPLRHHPSMVKPLASHMTCGTVHLPDLHASVLWPFQRHCLNRLLPSMLVCFSCLVLSLSLPHKGKIYQPTGRPIYLTLGLFINSCWKPQSFLFFLLADCEHNVVLACRIVCGAPDKMVLSAWK